MTDREVYSQLCSNCKGISTRSKIVDSYCKSCQSVLLKLEKWGGER
ncbi:MAG: hypothetical protein WC307_07035 [Candidatus Nanoarchaeia archaeon]|jgi:reverse gyrase